MLVYLQVSLYSVAISALSIRNKKYVLQFCPKNRSDIHSIILPRTNEVILAIVYLVCHYWKMCNQNKEAADPADLAKKNKNKTKIKQTIKHVIIL